MELSANKQAFVRWFSFSVQPLCALSCAFAAPLPLVVTERTKGTPNEMAGAEKRRRRVWKKCEGEGGIPRQCKTFSPAVTRYKITKRTTRPLMIEASRKPKDEGMAKDSRHGPAWRRTTRQCPSISRDFVHLLMRRLLHAMQHVRAITEKIAVPPAHKFRIKGYRNHQPIFSKASRFLGGMLCVHFYFFFLI